MPEHYVHINVCLFLNLPRPSRSLVLPSSLQFWIVSFDYFVDAMVWSLNGRLIFPTLEQCRIHLKRLRIGRMVALLSALRGFERSIILGPRSTALLLFQIMMRVFMEDRFNERSSIEIFGGTK